MRKDDDEDEDDDEDNDGKTGRIGYTKGQNNIFTMQQAALQQLGAGGAGQAPPQVPPAPSMEDVLNKLVEVKSRGYTDRAKYVAVLAQLDPAKLPKTWVLAVNEAVGEYAHDDKKKKVTDAERDAVAVAMIGMQWNDPTIYVSTMRNFISELQDVMEKEERNKRNNKYSASGSDSSSNSSKGSKSSQADRRRGQRCAMKKMIGTKGKPKPGKTFIGALDITGTECPSVITDAVRAELKTSDDRGLAKKLMIWGDRDLDKTWTEGHGWGMVWTFMKRIAQVITQAAMQLQGTRVGRDESQAQIKKNLSAIIEKNKQKKK